MLKTPSASIPQFSVVSTTNTRVPLGNVSIVQLQFLELARILQSALDIFTLAHRDPASAAQRYKMGLA